MLNDINDTRSDRGNGSTRRTFLVGTAAVTLVGSTGLAYGQQEETEIQLDGATSGWIGVTPASIEGETNPTLELEPGTTYTVVWENADGAPHNFVIETDDGENLVETEIIEEEGETQTVEFEATEEMAEYYCEVHPNSMRGDVRISDEEDAPEEDEDDESAIPTGPTVGLETVAEGLTSPVGFATANEDADRRFIVDQVGQIYVHGPDGLEDEPFLDVSDRLVDVGGATEGGFDERGLLGLAFHPDFAQKDNCRFYVRYSAPPREGTPEDYDHTEVLSEFRTPDDRSRGDPDSERVLLEIPSPQFNHNAGDLKFGPDGYLYLGMGDGGGANDAGLGHVEDWYDENEGGNGQDTTENLLGGILRIDVDDSDGDRPYGIPDDNPLVDEEGHLDEYYAWGMRNPWRISFDSEGRFFVADVGQNLFEEVNIVENGGNYGWNVKESTHCFSTETPNDPPETCPDSTPDDVRGGEPLIDPIIEYPQTQDDEVIGIAVTGGFVYEGDALEELQDGYVFGDWSRSFETPDGSLFVATAPDGDEMWSMEELVVDDTEDGRIGRFVLSFGRGHDDELYVLTTENSAPTGSTGVVHKIVPTVEN